MLSKRTSSIVLAILGLLTAIQSTAAWSGAPAAATGSLSMAAAAQPLTTPRGDPAVAANTAQIPKKFDKWFTGTIGNNLRVRMELSAGEGNLYGDYFYERIGTSIALDGKISPNGSFTVSERDDQGNATANFNGVVASRSASGKAQMVLSGTWSKAGAQGKGLPFSLAEEVFDLGAGRDLTSKAINRTSKNPKYEIEISYPQITGPNASAAFNNEMVALINNTIGDFKKDTGDASTDLPADSQGSSLTVGYQVTAATPEFISVVLTVSEYSAGAAHPNSYSVSVNYDLRTEKRIRLGDLFTTGSGYLQSISKICVTKLKSKLGQDSDADWIQRGAGPKLDNYKDWNITSTGLEITFDAYQVAAYAFGPQLVFMQYSELKPLIKADGPLAAFMR